MTPTSFCISDTSNSLSVLSKKFRKIYRLENFRANILKQVSNPITKFACCACARSSFVSLLWLNTPWYSYNQLQKWLFCLSDKKSLVGFALFNFFSRILLYLWLIDNRTECRQILSVIILVIKQVGLPLRGRPILLITRMITDWIGLHSVLLPLLILVIY